MLATTKMNNDNDDNSHFPGDSGDGGDTDDDDDDAGAAAASEGQNEEEVGVDVSALGMEAVAGATEATKTNPRRKMTSEVDECHWKKMWS